MTQLQSDPGLSPLDVGLDGAVDHGRVERACAEASIPALLMVVFQLTGDERWLQQPYRPRRTKGLTDNDSGGLSAEHQAEIRAAAVEALCRWAAGDLVPAIRRPDETLLLRMMSVCTGEEVSAEYIPMMSEEMGFAERETPWTAPAGVDFKVLVVGAGMSGLVIGAGLERDGIDYEVIEKNSAVGGTWLENRYPGCRVDTPSHIYTCGFHRGDWSHYYSTQPTLHDYFEQIATETGVRAHIRFDTEVVRAIWDDGDAMWTVALRDAAGERQVRANVLVSAVGQLNQPKIPTIAGQAEFAGLAFHSARWPDGLSLTGKRVAVIGTGASAMQIVPSIAGDAAQVTIYQRSPQWAAPSENYWRAVGDDARWLLTHVPAYEAWYRFWLAWAFNDRIHSALQIDPAWEHPERSVNAINDAHREFFTAYIEEELGDRRDLLDEVLPSYPPFGKRMLIDNGWYRTITRDDVELVSEPIDWLTPSGIRTRDGIEREFDVIVYATGFDVLRVMGPMEIRGRTGRTTREAWGEDDAYAYLGITVPEFPNLFCLYGPNTNLGHGGSLIFNSECQARYARELIHTMIDEDIAAVEVRAEVSEAYNAAVDDAHAHMIWSHPGTDVWYRNARGRVVTNSPWRSVDYWRMTRHPDLGDFQLRRRNPALAR